MVLTEGISSAWVIDEGEFEHQPKREPALLYSRVIPCAVGASKFVAGYFEGFAVVPESVGALYSDERAMPWGRKGSTLEERAHFMRVLGKSIGPEGDVWRDPELSFENYAGRALIGVAGGFEDRFVTLSAWTGVGAPSRQVVRSDSQGETTVVAEPELVVELHVPLVAAEGLAVDEYQLPWIDEIMDRILALDESDGAWMYDDGEEDGEEYVFFIAAFTEDAGLALAARLAQTPGLPKGAYATVSTADAEEFGLGRRVDLGS